MRNNCNDFYQYKFYDHEQWFMRKIKLSKEYFVIDSLKFWKILLQKQRFGAGFARFRSLPLVSCEIKAGELRNKSRNTNKILLPCLSCCHLMLNLSWDANRWCYMRKLKKHLLIMSVISKQGSKLSKITSAMTH